MPIAFSNRNVFIRKLRFTLEQMNSISSIGFLLVKKSPFLKTVIKKKFLGEFKGNLCKKGISY